MRASGASRAAALAAVVVALALGALTACTGSAEPSPSVVTPSDGAPTSPPASPTADLPAGPVVPAATSTPQDVVTGLRAPWGLAFLPGGAVLITQRDDAQVLLLTSEGIAALTGPGAEDLAATTLHGGEGGLLGIAVSPAFADDRVVFLYRTTSAGNEVVRTELDVAGGSLGALEPVLDGIPAARNHDGGRLAFGPDGYLYVTTGDAGDRPTAQDPASLGGKILRITTDGEPAPGNPTPDSPVWSLGHRNVQGIGWAPDGRLFAAEFGQNTWDELNLVEPGANHGWPEVEGVGDDDRFTDPVATWPTSEASPSGLAVTADAVYLAALRGARLWVVPLTAPGVGEPYAQPGVDLGRLRAVDVGPDGALWILTNNTDGRGDPSPGDDRLVRVLPG